MSHPLLSEAIREAYATSNQNIDVFETIEVKSSIENFFICTGFKQRTIVDELGDTHVCQPAPFTFNFPQQTNSGSSILTLNIENVDGQVMAFINRAKATGQPVTIRYRNHVEGLSGSQNPRPVILTLVSATATLAGVQFQASIADFVNRSFPNAFYSFALFPGLRK